MIFFLVSKFISLLLTRILMMTTWKYEGRSAILLMTFMVQTLLIIIGGMRINHTGRLRLFVIHDIPLPLSLAPRGDFPSVYKQ